MSEVSLMWFRQDLRLDDNPALFEACGRGGKLILVYLWSPEELAEGSPGAASRLWLHGSLQSLAKDLEERGHTLGVINTSSCRETLRSLCLKHKVTHVFWNRLYEPATIERDRWIKSDLEALGVEVHSYSGHLLWEPWNVLNQSKKPFQVYSAFWRSGLKSQKLRQPLGKPAFNKVQAVKISSGTLDSCDLVPDRPWAKEVLEFWNVGESASRAKAKAFVRARLKDYPEERNRPDHEGSSQLGMALHFGELSVRRLWAWVECSEAPASACEVYLKELVWREFAHHLLYHFPEMTREPLKKEFAGFPWGQNAKFFKAWCRGQTGYPIVDAGMRQLWKSGWMHNRVRMIVASFLVKDLLIPWQKGERWFWDTLLDANLANNVMGWQWTSGCGADAAPFFRVFNPILQGEKFDPEGDYVRRWVPELKNLPKKWIHQPWRAPEEVLKSAGVLLGKGYPRPIVDHAEARDVALKAFKKLSKK